MRNNIENYEALLESANETASAYLDMEGGEFLLSWIGEVIENLTANGYVRSATLAAQKLCDAVGVDVPWTVDDDAERAEKLEWLHIFAEALMDCVKRSNE